MQLSKIENILMTVAVAIVALGVITWLRWRRRVPRRSPPVPVSVTDAKVPIQAEGVAEPDCPYDLLLVCDRVDSAERIERWLSAQLLIRIAVSGKEAVERLIERRPDIVWLLLEDSPTVGLALTQQLRGMQADAYEAPSWIVALTSDAQSQRTSSETEIFDQMLPEPRSQNACVDAFRATIASIPKANGRPWIQQATESAMPGFLASRQKLAQAIRQAVLEGRSADAAKSAHTLGGSPGMHDFEYGVAACRYIERHHATAKPEELLARADTIGELLALIELR